MFPGAIDMDDAVVCSLNLAWIVLIAGLSLLLRFAWYIPYMFFVF